MQIGFTLLNPKRHSQAVFLTVGCCAIWASTGCQAASGDTVAKSLAKPSGDQSKSSDDLGKLIAKAEELRTQGSFLRAQSLLSGALKEHPADFQLSLAQARLLRSMGLFARSKTLYQSLHTSEPNAVEPLIALSQMSLESLGMESALKYAREALSVAPDLKSVHLALAAALLANNSIADANTELNVIEHKFPSSAEIYYLRYQLLLKQDQRPEALSALEAAVKLKPTNSPWLFDLSSLYEQEGDYTSSLDLLNRYLRLNPTSVEALSRVAALYEYNFHDYDKAVVIYQEILNIDPDVVDAVVGIDRCEHKGNDLAAALKDQLWKFLRQSQTFGGTPKAAPASARNSLPRLSP